MIAHRRTRRWLAAVLLIAGNAALAEETVAICFNYGCAVEAEASYSEARLGAVAELLAASDNAAQERLLLSVVIGQMYRWAAEQTPVGADRAGNLRDDGVRGAMDCIDHATTTSRFLSLLERRGNLRYHRVLEPARRGWLFQHYSAQIEELEAGLMEVDADAARFAIDSWYVDNGQPAVVAPLNVWKGMAGIDA